MTDTRTPTGRPHRLYPRLRAFILASIADGSIEGTTQIEFAERASKEFDYHINARRIQNHTRLLGLVWAEVSTRKTRDAIRAILTNIPHKIAVIDIQESLASQGIKIHKRTLARLVAPIRVELECDKTKDG